MTMKRINAGKYRNIITIEKQDQTTGQNAYGEVENNENNWVEVYKTRAGIYPFSGKEILTALYSNAEISTRIHLRYDPSFKVTSDMRVRFEDRIFTIMTPPINFQERDMEIQLLCKEVI